jgi:molecular chaperone DnaK (HSP70)
MAKGKQGKSSKTTSAKASGTATPGEQIPPRPQQPARPTVLGVNFGHSFSSIAVINKEERADCIANEDGERQIPNAIAYSEEQEVRRASCDVQSSSHVYQYIGAPARQQLVRNAPNVILGSRQLLGQRSAPSLLCKSICSSARSYDQAKSFTAPYGAAPLVEAAGQPGFAVQAHGSAKTFTATETATTLLTYLVSCASDYLGRKIDAACFAVPSTASTAELDALRAVARAAGISVLQILPDAVAVVAGYDRLAPSAASTPDRTVVVLDVGATTTTATVLGLRSGIAVPLGSSRKAGLGGDAIDDAFIAFLAKEFTKKTKLALDLAAPANARSAMKLRLAAETTKRSLSASASANCSVESLAEGMDFSLSVNRTRFDLLCSRVYGDILAVVEGALKEASVEAVAIDEVRSDPSTLTVQP